MLTTLKGPQPQRILTLRRADIRQLMHLWGCSSRGDLSAGQHRAPFLKVKQQSLGENGSTENMPTTINARTANAGDNLDRIACKWIIYTKPGRCLLPEIIKTDCPSCMVTIIKTAVGSMQFFHSKILNRLYIVVHLLGGGGNTAWFRDEGRTLVVKKEGSLEK